MDNETMNISEELMNLIEEKKYSEFKRSTAEMNPVDIAQFFGELPKEKIRTVFRLLAKDIAADVFAELDSQYQEDIISGLTDSEVGFIIEDLYIDDAVDMLEEMPAGVVTRILRNAAPETRKTINKFLSYPEDSAGSVMTAEFVDIHLPMTVGGAIEKIRRTGFDKETVYVVYVTDSRRVLEGFFELKDLIFADPNDPIESIMDRNIISATTTDDKETVAGLISKYDLIALPVVDKESRLVGIVTVDDALDVMEEEATEDIEKMAAITPTDKPYMQTGVFETWKKRIPWLLILMISATFTSLIIGHYESAISGVVALSAFMPMLMDTGGNAGGQASVTIIRGLSLGDIKMGDFLRVMWKEFRVSLLCGVTMSAATFAKLMLIDRTSFEIALVVSVTLIITIIVAKFVGSMLPILAKRIGFDPAVMASPFITTIVDAISLVLYFRVATLILHL